MAYINTSRYLLFFLLIFLVQSSCKKVSTIEFPEVDEFYSQEPGIEGTKWVDISHWPNYQALSMAVVDNALMLTLTGGDPSVSLLYESGSFSGTNQTINSFSGFGGTGISKVKRVNNQWYGMGSMGNYGLFKYDSTLYYAPWNPVSNLNAEINGFDMVNTTSYVSCQSAPYIRYEQMGSWLQLGTALDNPAYDLITFNGELIAAGSFVNAGSTVLNHVARWDGAQWQPMDVGLNGIVRDLEIYQGNLVAVGGFTSSGAGNTDCKYVAVWNGSTWESLSTGLTGGYYGVMNALAYKNELFLGGDFDAGGGVLSPNIIKWSGNQFKSVANGVNDPVGAMAIYKGQLYVSNLVYYLYSNFVLKLTE